MVCPDLIGFALGADCATEMPRASSYSRICAPMKPPLRVRRTLATIIDVVRSRSKVWSAFRNWSKVSINDMMPLSAFYDLAVRCTFFNII
jgi:hypothetical protein